MKGISMIWDDKLSKMRQKKMKEKTLVNSPHVLSIKKVRAHSSFF